MSFNLPRSSDAPRSDDEFDLAEDEPEANPESEYGSDDDDIGPEEEEVEVEEYPSELEEDEDEPISGVETSEGEEFEEEYQSEDEEEILPLPMAQLPRSTVSSTTPGSTITPGSMITPKSGGRPISSGLALPGSLPMTTSQESEGEESEGYETEEGEEEGEEEEGEEGEELELEIVPGQMNQPEPIPLEIVEPEPTVQEPLVNFGILANYLVMVAVPGLLEPYTEYLTNLRGKFHPNLGQFLRDENPELAISAWTFPKRFEPRVRTLIDDVLSGRLPPPNLLPVPSAQSISISPAAAGKLPLSQVMPTALPGSSIISAVSESVKMPQKRGPRRTQVEVTPVTSVAPPSVLIGSIPAPVQASLIISDPDQVLADQYLANGGRIEDQYTSEWVRSIDSQTYQTFAELLGLPQEDTPVNRTRLIRVLYFLKALVPGEELPTIPSVPTTRFVPGTVPRPTTVPVPRPVTGPMAGPKTVPVTVTVTVPETVTTLPIDPDQQLAEDYLARGNFVEDVYSRENIESFPTETFLTFTSLLGLPEEDSPENRIRVLRILYFLNALEPAILPPSPVPLGPVPPSRVKPTRPSVSLPELPPGPGMAPFVSPMTPATTIEPVTPSEIVIDPTEIDPGESQARYELRVGYYQYLLGQGFDSVQADTYSRIKINMIFDGAEYNPTVSKYVETILPTQ